MEHYAGIDVSLEQSSVCVVDGTGRISKIGDAGVRTMLYEAANVILTRTSSGKADTTARSQVPSPGRGVRPGRKLLRGAGMPHQVAAVAPTPDRSATPAIGPKLQKEG